MLTLLRNWLIIICPSLRLMKPTMANSINEANMNVIPLQSFLHTYNFI